MRIKLLMVLLMLNLQMEGQINLEYQVPHPDILSLADVDPPASLSLNSDASHGLLLRRSAYMSIEELSEDEVRLAGLRINPKLFISSRARYVQSIRHLDPNSQKESDIAGLPQNGKFSKMAWSPDESKVAVLNTVGTGVELWLIDLNKKNARRLTEAMVQANLGTTIVWNADSESLFVKMRPAVVKSITDRQEIIPKGPTVSENDGQKAQNRTYQDLLKNPTDEANFEILAESEVWRVALSGEKTLFLPPALYDDLDVSPDGKYVLVSHIQRPYSYLVPYYRFPYTYTVYGLNGKKISTPFNIPLIEEMPKGFMAVTTHPRGIRWRSDEGAVLVFVEALDNGDPAMEVEYRDAVYQIEYPFDTAKKRLLVKTKERFSGISWGLPDYAILTEYWWNTRNARTLSFNPSNANEAPVLMMERNYQDRYNDPGYLATKKNIYGLRVLDIVDDQLYLIGDGYSEKGKFPFIDRMDRNTGTLERLFQCTDENKLEDFASPIDLVSGKILTVIESKTEFPNYFIRDIFTGELKPITRNKNPFSVLDDVHKEVIHYKRSDGVDLSATLYLPAGYDRSSNEKLPMLMWAYPREFKDKNSAGQTTNNPNEFTYPYWGSPLFWVNRGYAVLDDAAFPILGESENEPNDRFIEQLVDNAKAAIDAVDGLGYIDRERVAVGGHSYGAFMTANLLSHSNLFAAGIARSGAYNRTLTPFGFQSEERSYWEAPEIYYNMSPFMHADKMKTPLLLIHGEADNNSGTYPMQSERYFNALKGLGATVRLVMLPKESHGYAAKESILHLLWEQDRWLEQYVKNKHSESRP